MKYFMVIKICILILILFSHGFSQNNPVLFFADQYSQSQKQNALDDLLDKGIEAISLLREGFNNEDESVKIQCIKLLAQIGDKKIVPDLINNIKIEPRTRNKLVSLYALGQIKDQKSLQFLKDAINNEDDIIRRGAIIASGLFGDKSVIPDLEKILNDPNEIMRVFAAGSLGMLGSKMGFQVAAEGTNSFTNSIKMHSIQALGLIGDKSALPILNKLKTDKHSYVINESINLAIFQISINQYSEYEKIKKIKNKFLEETGKSATKKWCLDEIERIKNKDSKIVLEQISMENIPDIFLKQVMRKIKIINLFEELNNGGGDE